jgi:hypothetical protein
MKFSKSESTLPEIFFRKLLKLATPIVTTRNEVEDRWGNLCGVDVYAVRLGNYCVLISHFPDVGDPDSPPQTEVERLVRVDETMRYALEIFHSYYEELQPRFQIQSGQHLPDKTKQVGALLDRQYSPTAGVDTTSPSSILPQIVAQDQAGCPDKWAWFEETLHLTKCVGRRTGETTGRYFFDESLAEIFDSLKFKVQKVQLREIEVTIPFRNIVERSLKIEKAEELESSICSATYALRAATEKVNKLQAKIERLKRELEALGSP